MVHTITRMVHAGSHLRWAVTFLFHVFGGVLGGLATAGLIAALVHATGLRALGVSLAISVLIIALAFDTRVIRAGVPSPNRQVPKRWREYFTPRTTAFLYGAGLGMGITTRIYFASTYAVFLLAGLLLPFREALLVGAAFGAARSASVWIAYRPENLDALRAALGRREGRRRLVRAANAAAQVAAIAIIVGFK